MGTRGKNSRMVANLKIENLFLYLLYLNTRCSNILDADIRCPTFTNNQWTTRGTPGHGRGFPVSIGWKF